MQLGATEHTPRRLIVLGSTGSIGVQTLQVIEHLNKLHDDTQADNAHRGDKFTVVGLAAGSKAAPLIEQAKHFRVPAVAIYDETQAPKLHEALPGVTIYAGPDAAEQLVQNTDATDVSAAVVGSAGLPATLAAARKGMRIGLANKETLVAAGALVTPVVQESSASLLPVDSEHSAIFQCLHAHTREADPAAVKRIVLTASGGPFLDTPLDTMNRATVEQALKHPTWDMGPKITIDSATMMNKALEIIEAHWLFGLPPEQIDVIIHLQSVIHSFVEFADNSILAQLGPPDMRTPIKYALTYPRRIQGGSEPMDWTKLTQLDFRQPDKDKFRSLALAYRVIRMGGTAGAIFNAANEAAVDAFLKQRIRFGRIVDLVDEAITRITPKPADSLKTILDADREAKAFVRDRVGTSDTTPGPVTVKPTTRAAQPSR